MEDPDLRRFHAFETDPEARWMAAFASREAPSLAESRARWKRSLRDPAVAARTILADGRPVGYVVRFPLFGLPSVAYWIDRRSWGRGIATAALRRFLGELKERPLHARVAVDNLASRRVLEKCGFRTIGKDRGRAEARGAEVEELVMRLARPTRRAGERARPRRSGSDVA